MENCPVTSERDKETLKLFDKNGITVKEYWENATKGRDKGSETYDQRVNPYRHQVAVHMYLKHLAPQPSELILDAGCGTGRYTKKILEKGSKVISVDLSFYCLKVSKTKCEKYNKNQLLIVADVRNLPFKKNTFNKILMIEVYQHIPLSLHKTRVLQQLHENLKGKGTLVLSNYNFDLRCRLKKDKEALLNKAFYYYRYTWKELRDELETIFSDSIKVLPIMNIIPLASRLGKLGVFLDCLSSNIPFVSYVRGHQLLAVIKKR